MYFERIGLGKAGMRYDEVPEYRSRFNKALTQEGLRAGNVRMKEGDECTVGSIDTVNLQGMTVNEFLDRVKRVHIRFLELIST